MFRRKQAETGGNNNRLVIRCVAKNRPVEPALKRRSRQRQAETGEKNQPKGGVKAETGRDRQKGRGRKKTPSANKHESEAAPTTLSRRKQAETGRNRQSACFSMSWRSESATEAVSRQKQAETGGNTGRYTAQHHPQAGWRCARARGRGRECWPARIRKKRTRRFGEGQPAEYHADE